MTSIPLYNLLLLFDAGIVQLLVFRPSPQRRWERVFQRALLVGALLLGAMLTLGATISMGEVFRGG